MINDSAAHEAPLYLWYTSECHYEFVQDADRDEWLARKVPNDEEAEKEIDTRYFEEVERISFQSSISVKSSGVGMP